MPETKRLNFFAGQLISAADLQTEQDYHREKLRLHHRLLHGTGVVRGLKVSVTGAGRDVKVSPGVAIDPLGELLALDAPASVPIRRSGTSCHVCLRYAERDGGDVPLIGSDTNTASGPAFIVETCEVVVEETPDEETDVVLARLVRRGRKWTCDRKRTVAKVR